MKKVVNVPAIGEWIDCNAFGGIYVDRGYQERFIEREKERWLYTINCPKKMCTRMVKDENGTYSIESFLDENPYFGSKPEELVFECAGMLEA